MGNCAGSCAEGNKNKYQIKIDKFYKVPDDTQKYKHLNAIKRPFSAELANVKIKKCPYKQVGIKIKIDDQEYYKLGNKTVIQSQDIKWKFEKGLDFMKTDYQIRKSFLIVEVIDQNQNIVGSLRINLYLICIGPYHQDFIIEFKNGKMGRISFDFKVSQLIQLNLQTLEAQINLLKKHPGENFAFSIKTIVGSDTKISKPSYPVQVMLDQKVSNKYIQPPVDIVKLTRKRSQPNLISKQVKQLKQGHNLQWSKAQCGQMPSISMKILLHKLHHSYFQILLIKYQQIIESVPDQQIPDVVTIKQQIFAECYIAFHKLFTKEPQLYIKNDICFQKRFIQIQQKIWVHGRQFGKAKFNFYVQNQKYIRQMQVCVRTEEGISKTSPVFAVDEDRQDQSCKEVDELMKLGEDIQLSIIKLQQCEEGYFQMKRLKSQIQDYLSKMLPILEKTSKQSMILYSYLNPKQLIKAQKVLIDIGLKIAAYVEQEDQTIGQLCWLILISLIKRGQFRLSNIGFNQRQRKQLLLQKPEKITKKKVQVALMYQQFMYKLLNLALTSLNFKGSQTQRAFAQIFCAYAYFRIPDFRNQMLNIIKRENDEEVPEWRGIQFSLNEDIDYTSLRQDVDSFTALFDWEQGFHQCLKYVNKTEGKNDLDLSQILSNQNWKYRFQKRGPAFFAFIKYWITYVQGLVIKSRDIQWKYFPGYNRLLKVFFLELKRRAIIQYPDILKQTANRLIGNERIFSPIVYILFNKANIYDPLSVIKVIELVSDLLSTLKKKNKQIPSLFNYAHFFRGIQIILDSDFLLMIQTTLIMLYTHYHMFHWEFRKNLCVYLLKKVFFKLFLHWSLNVRNVFHHLLVYRISDEINYQIMRKKSLIQDKSKQQNILNLKQLFDSTFDELERISIQLKSKTKNHLIKKREVELYKIMKKKLIQKKLYKAKKQLLEPKTVHDIVANEFPQSDNQNNPICVEKRRKQTLLFKPSYDENLVQPRIDRTQSQIIKQNRVSFIYKNYKLNKKQQEVIELNKQNSIKLKNQILDTTQVRDDLQSMDIILGKRIGKLNPIFNAFDEISTDLVPITQQQTQYIEKALTFFEQIKQTYNKGIVGGKAETVPKIQRQQVSVDQRQIRPENIDDW